MGFIYVSRWWQGLGYFPSLFKWSYDHGTGTTGWMKANTSALGLGTNITSIQVVMCSLSAVVDQKNSFLYSQHKSLVRVHRGPKEEIKTTSGRSSVATATNGPMQERKEDRGQKWGISGFVRQCLPRPLIKDAMRRHAAALYRLVPHLSH